jgi:uncharacterized phiE125 gp8 family phage protein
MALRLGQYTAPAAEPVHLTEAKLHLRLAVDAAGAVSYTSEDGLLSSLISAARQVAETETWKAQVLQVWDMYLDGWPMNGEIKLPMPPLRAVEFIKYTDTTGVVNTLAATEYEVDTVSPLGRVVLGYDKSWPTADLTVLNPIHIRFRAGYAVPFIADATANTLTGLNHPHADGDKVRLSVSGGSLPTGLAANTDYFVRDVSGNTLKLAATVDGTAIDITSAGSGTMFIGEIPATTISGIKLVLSGLYEERGEFATGTIISNLPRAASSLFGMDSAKEF